MKPWGWAALAICLVFGAALDHSISARMAILGGGPEFLLTFAIVGGLLAGPGAACGLGFLAGLIAGGMTGESMTGLIVSRVTAAFATSQLVRLQVQVNAGIAAVYVIGGVFGARVLLLALGGGGGLVPWLAASAFSAILSGIAALPVYALLSRSAAAKDS